MTELTSSSSSFDATGIASLNDLESSMMECVRAAGRVAHISVRVSPLHLREFLLPGSRDTWASLQRRFPKTRIALIAHDGVSAELGFSGAPTAGVDQATVGEIRRADLTAVLEASGAECFFLANELYHYIAPSGKHCRSFVRIADAFRSRWALESVAFWLARELRAAVEQQHGLLLDSWSIAAPVMRAMHLIGASIPYDALERHPAHRDDGGGETVDALAARAEATFITCVVSVGSSGAFAESIRRLCRTRGIDVRFVYLYALKTGAVGQSDEVVLCQLVDDPENAEPDACGLCAVSRAVPLDPSLYYLRDSKPRFVTLGTLDMQAGRGSAPLPLDLAARVGALQLHRSAAGERHQAYHVDVGRLMTSNEFWAKVDHILPRSSYDVVIGVASSATPAFAKDVGTRLGSQFAAVDLDGAIVGNRAAVASARRILVVDDVCITGSALEGVNRFIRERSGATPSSVDFMVAVARPTSDVALRMIVSHLTKKHSWSSRLLYVYSIFLPDWAAGNCGWCRERVTLRERFDGASRLPPVVMDRLRTLDGDFGLSTDVHLCPGGVPRRTLGDGSPLGPLGLPEVGVAFAVASAIQGLRNRAQVGDALKPAFPFFQYLGEENLRRYSEPLIRAALFRAVLPDEMGDGMSRPPAILKAAASYFEDGDHPLLLGEACLRYRPTPAYDELVAPLEVALGRLGWSSDDASRLLGRGRPRAAQPRRFVGRAKARYQRALSALGRWLSLVGLWRRRGDL